MQRFGAGITMAIGTKEIKIGRQVCRQAAKSIGSANVGYLLTETD